MYGKNIRRIYSGNHYNPTKGMSALNRFICFRSVRLRKKLTDRHIELAGRYALDKTGDQFVGSGSMYFPTKGNIGQHQILANDIEELKYLIGLILDSKLPERLKGFEVATYRS
jgi:hypothetical protein